LSNENDFRQRALANRYLLVQALAYHSRQAGQGASATAYELTRAAIKAGFVADRKPVDGVTFDGWITKRNPPAWGVRAAILLLAQLREYVPTLEQQESIALSLAELYPDKEAAALLQDLPEHWPREGWDAVFVSACQVRKRRIVE